MSMNEEDEYVDRIISVCNSDPERWFDYDEIAKRIGCDRNWSAILMGYALAMKPREIYVRINPDTQLFEIRRRLM